MDVGRAALERLQQVRLDRVAQEDRHRTGDAEILGGDGLPLTVRGHDDPAKARSQVEEVAREGEDRHHLRGDGDHPLGLTGDAVLLAAEADHRPPDRPVADVDHARPAD